MQHAIALEGSRQQDFKTELQLRQGKPLLTIQRFNHPHTITSL